MWFKHRAWIPVAWILSAINVAAVWFAAASGEPLHATAHALLGALFAVGARHLMARRQQQPGDEVRLEQLQRSVDVMALEVERISEGQRYVTKVLNESLQPAIEDGRAHRGTGDRANLASDRDHE